jgi:ubiquinone/menaquinone biosynthesis C-methylase UbiE
MNTLDKYRQANRNMWDEFAVINSRSALYNVDEFKRGRTSLDALILSEMGEVTGKSLLHLQCHFGLDTLSLARMGAKATGMDFSPEGIRIARELAEELGIPARFICCDLYDLPENLDEEFDCVFTSYGALCWLPDIPRWAHIVGHFLKPGGVFYVAEFHPFSNVFKNEGNETGLEVAYPYFTETPLEFPVEGSYADPDAKINQQVEYEWSPQVGEIITGLIDAGMQIEFVHEFPFTCYRHFPFLVKQEEDRWYLPEGMPSIPLTFTLRAHKLK